MNLREGCLYWNKLISFLKLICQLSHICWLYSHVSKGSCLVLCVGVCRGIKAALIHQSHRHKTKCCACGRVCGGGGVLCSWDLPWVSQNYSVRLRSGDFGRLNYCLDLFVMFLELFLSSFCSVWWVVLSWQSAAKFFWIQICYRDNPWTCSPYNVALHKLTKVILCFHPSVFLSLLYVSVY